MSVAAHAATPAAEHPEPHPAATGALPRGGGLTVRVPLRLVVGAQYADAALSVYVKIAALALRPEGCTAKVATIAEYLGMSKSAVERALKELTRPDDADGLVEVPTRRRTYKDGRGQSAERYVRPIAADELWVRIPVRAAEVLAPRLLRLYALLAYSTARRIPVTAAELGEMLHHHTGQRAGEHLGERQARRLVDDLESTGWLTVHRREGERGRHAYEPNRHPLRVITATAGEDGAGAPVIHDGSGAGDHDGSLASKEDLQTDRHEKTQVVGGSRRRRPTGSKPVENPVDHVPATFGPGTPRAPRGNRTPRPGTDNPTGQAPYTGPEFRWTKRIHDALAPVRHELDGIRRHVLRQIAVLIGTELDANPASSSDRIADRIARRLRPLMREDIRSMGGWLLQVGLPHRGCGLDTCEDGQVWPTGEPCEICAHAAQVQRAQWKQARELQARLDELRQQAAAGTAPQLPAKATYRQRDTASDAEVRRAITEHGPAGALHIYGHLRVGPLLRAEGVQEQLPTPAAPPVPVRTAVVPGRMPDEMRAAATRPAAGERAVTCPTCQAPPGHHCTSKRGRRRAAHEARLDVTHPAAYRAASGEDT
ncbi:zinc finger domain-containing protein [Streptomyces sp. NPDC002692]